MVYVADRSLTNWTKSCIQQADEIIAFGAATAESNLTAVEAEILRVEETKQARSRKTLVLQHPPGTARPQGTIHWLSKRSVDRHFHIRADDQGDLERIVRFVSRREIGLVLSGGGSRGFAHVGIIRAIREAKLPVDVIGGVSMGAIIAAAYACSEDLDAKVSVLKERVGGMFSDYTFPFVSLARGRRFDRCLKALFGGTNIEDLWMRYFCLSSNLTSANMVVHQTGPLWRAIRASGSLPGLVSPVVENGELLYDGCLLNNLPVDLMRDEIQTGSLIAVDVVPPVDLDIRATGLESPSGWRIAWNQINPFAKAIEMPGIVSVLQRAGALGSISNRQQLIDEGIADLYLSPPVEQFKILDFSVADEAIEIGYTYGVSKIGAWVQSRH